MARTTVAVSFQIVLVIGQSKFVVPINAAGALNYDCTACLTTAIADQIMVTLKSQPSKELAAQLAADLKQLNRCPSSGPTRRPRPSPPRSPLFNRRSRRSCTTAAC